MFIFSNPVKIIVGSIELLPVYVKQKNILLVTSAGFERRGVVNRIKDILDSKNIITWTGFTSNPDIQELESAAEIFRTKEIDCVVGLGGGSALDAAKVLANILSKENVWSLEYIFNNNISFDTNFRLPLIAIPTTAGTGAEVTPFATVWDRKNFKKNSMSGENLYPDIAILDENLTMTLGENDTLYPALDSISHCLESIWNINCTPISVLYSYGALDRLNVSLKKIIIDPDNIKERANLQLASVMAGIAISQTRTAVAHSISYPLTIQFGVPHGLACSFTLPYLIDKHLEVSDETKHRHLLLEIKELLNSMHLIRRLNNYLTKDEALNTLQYKKKIPDL